MKYYHSLYVSKMLQPKISEIVSKFERGEIQFNKYIIVLAQNERNHLEFLDSILLQQKIMDQENLFVVGVAESYRSAVKLVQQITDEVYKKTKDTNIRKYIMENQENVPITKCE